MRVTVFPQLAYGAPSGPPDTFGHHMYDCPKLYDDAQDEALRWDPKLDYIQKHFQSVGVTGLGDSDWNTFERCVGTPLCPPAIQRVPQKMPVVLLGD